MKRFFWFFNGCCAAVMLFVASQCYAIDFFPVNASTGETIEQMQTDNYLTVPERSVGNNIILTLVNTNTAEDLYELNDSDAIDLSNGKDLTIRADINTANLGAVSFAMDGSVVQTEHKAPYLLGGDNGQGTYYPWSWALSAGSHTLAVVAYDAGGASVAQRTMTFLIQSQGQADALYVSAEDGNDDVSYADNDIHHPWKTVAHAWASAKDGDVVYYRAGVYAINSTINVASSGEGVTHAAYPGESVTWSSPLTGAAVIEIGEPDTTIDGINVESAISGGDGGFFRLGWNRNGSHPNGFTLRNATCTTSGHGDNTGIVHGRGGSSYATIENCELIGAGIFNHCGPSGDGPCLNNTGIIMFQGKGWVVKNTIIHNFNTGLFFNKHPNPKSDHDSKVMNNWIYDCGAAIRTATNYTSFSNNILDGPVVTGYVGGYAADGNCGSDFNTYKHNTFIGNVELASQTYSTDNEYPGAQHNTFQDNVFVQTFQPMPYNNAPHHSILDYNLYPTGRAVWNNRQFYSLSDWQSTYGQDEHSLEGSPAFVGAEPHAIEDYQLSSGSTGFQGASDGTDMGADVSLVGP